jgi:hypothetical protein
MYVATAVPRDLNERFHSQVLISFLCGCRYMKRQPLVELFYIYYNCTVYTDKLELEVLKNNNNSELCNILNVVLKCTVGI